MSIHFAAARSAACSPVARALAKKAVGLCANDNPGGAGGFADPVLNAALRHFAEHGLHAAAEAARLARIAFESGETETCRFWTRICETFDRRLARELAKELTEGTTLISA